MFRKATFISILVLALVILVPVSGFAGSFRFCTHWKVKYVDSGFYEDYLPGATSWRFVHAKWAHYQVRKKSDNSLVDSGILNSDGCTEYMTLNSYTEYKFRQATKVERTGDNRKIYVEYAAAPEFGPYYTWLNSYYTTGNPRSATTVTLTPHWESDDARCTVIASRVMSYYATLEYPANTTTYIWPRPDWSNSQTLGTNIAIDTSWYSGHGGLMDHSFYKFIIGHELGHRQADATGGPYGGSSGEVDTEEPKCNCEHLTTHKAACMQSREEIYFAESEGWAYFYSAALMNSRDTNCGMGYYRPMYVGVNPHTAYLDSTPPVQVNCTGNHQWVSELCDDADMGSVYDWISFYWNVWTDGTYTYSVDELSDVWESTSGGLWIDLLYTVGIQHEFGSNKYWQFRNKGEDAAVNL